ncbi:MAG: tetratricopeptide repeat protein [Candidatus Cloacimonetes bacterium]|nr:tetratricopeptide repeat protein [Candidatus Cloacimonadota bacterium]
MLKNIFSKSNRCKRCKRYRGHRTCLRTGKQICWHCCNELRCDGKCEESCKYTLKNVEANSGFVRKAVSESAAEYTDLLKAYIDVWVIRRCPELDDQTPITLSQTDEGKKQLDSYLENLQIPEAVPVNYLRNRLKLPVVKKKPLSNSPEEAALAYMELLASAEWEKLPDYVYPKREGDFREHFVTRCKDNKNTASINNFNVLSCSVTENREQALVHFDVNYAGELTLYMVLNSGKWLVASRIFGPPKLHNDLNTVYRQVALLLNNNKLADCYDMLKKMLQLYPDSADLNYYQGMYYLLSRLPEKAEAYFLTALEIEPWMTEVKYNLALTQLAVKKTEQAELLFRELIAADEKDFRSQNNLAAILIDKGNPKEAEKLLKLCLQTEANYEPALKNMERISGKK